MESIESANSPRLLQILIGYTPIGLIAVTIVCNCFTLFIYSQKVFTKVSATFYLKAMGLFDMLNVFQVLYYAPPYAFGVNLRNFSSFACQILFFGTLLSHNMSSWCEALVSLDRCIQVKYRGKFEIFNKIWFKFLITGTIFLLNSSLYYPIFAYFHVFTIQISANETMVTCFPTNLTYFRLFSWIDLFTTLLIPFAVMFGSTIFLVASLINSRKRAIAKASENPSIHHNAKSNEPQNESSIVNNNSQSRAPLKSREERDFNFALTSISLNILSLLLNLPIGIYVIYVINVAPSNQLLFIISNLCLHFNLTLKFFIYLLVNKKFRAEFLKILF